MLESSEGTWVAGRVSGAFIRNRTRRFFCFNYMNSFAAVIFLDDLLSHYPYINAFTVLIPPVVL